MLHNYRFGQVAQQLLGASILCAAVLHVLSYEGA